MTPPPTRDHGTPNGLPSPLPLEYERPGATRRLPTSRVTVAALAVGLLSVLSALFQARALAGGGQPLSARWPELAIPLLPLVGIGLSLNALFRIADPKERVSGEGMAWIALLLNLLATPPNMCCFGLRFVGNFI